MDAVRIDKWLWAARFFKTRSVAVDAIKEGRVKVNGKTAKPAKEVVVGDEIRVLVAGMHRELVVQALSDRRGPATVAAELYEETPESIAERERRLEQRRLMPRVQEGGGARPTKRDRRRYDQVTGSPRPKRGR